MNLLKSVQRAPNSYDQVYLQEQQRQRFAQALRDSSLQDIPGQMVSGHYVGSGILPQIARLVKAYVGSKEMDDSTQRLDEAKASYNTENAKVMSEILRAADTSPEAAQGVAMQYADNPTAQQYLAAALQGKSGTDRVLQYLKVDTPEGPKYVAGMTSGKQIDTKLPVAEELKFLNAGDQYQAVGKYTGAETGNPVKINVSPDAKLRADSSSGNNLPDLTDEAVTREAQAVRQGARTGLSKFDKAGQRLISNRVAELDAEEGTDFTTTNARKAELKQLDSSLLAQEKRRGAMQSFVQAMDANMDKMGKLAEKMSSYDARFMNIPRRAWQSYVTGSPEKAIFETYLADLSREAAKIASASEASIAGMPVEEAKKFDALHDPNLSLADLLQVMQATTGTAHSRFDTVVDGLNRDRERRRQIQDRKDRGEDAPVPSYAESIGKKSLPLTNNKGWKLKEIYYEGKLHRAYVGPNPSTDVEEVKSWLLIGAKPLRLSRPPLDQLLALIGGRLGMLLMIVENLIPSGIMRP